MSDIRPDEAQNQNPSNGAAVLISDETQWRRRPHQDGLPGWAALAQVAVSRWRSSAETTREVRAHIPEDCHVVGIALRSVQRRILVNGRIAELGTHEELLTRNGYYTSLFEKQRLEEELSVAT